MKNLFSFTRAVRVWFIVAVSFAFTGPLLAQQGGVLSTDKTSIPVSATSTVLFRVAIPQAPALIKESVTLQRANGASWVIVGRMYDDGTHGDLVAGDSTFSLAVAWTPTSLGVLNFRASSAYKGQLIRSNSNTASVTVTKALELVSTAGSTEVVLVQGSSVNVLTTIALTNAAGQSLGVTNTTSINPAGGLVITSDYPPGGWVSSETKTFVINQKITGLALGDYQITNAAAAGAVNSASTITVHVLPVGGDPEILPVGATPDTVTVGKSTFVTFTASISNFFQAPETLTLRETEGGALVGTMKDDGAGDDLQAGDGVFTCTVPVLVPSEGTRSYFAEGTFAGVPDVRKSDAFLVHAVSYPSEPSIINPAKVITDPESGQGVVSDLLLVTFKSSMTGAQLASFADLHGLELVGSLPGLGIFEFRFPNPSNSLALLLEKISTVGSDVLVEAIGSNPVTQVLEVTPNDPRFANQYAPTKIRADEAWVIARGGPVIAIVDTGVDYTHEDLAGRVIKGKDFVNGDDDPMDDQGHGTHCAGIAAAPGNNAKGVAGIAWNSRILAVKVANAAGNISMSQGAAAIKYSADRGAKVISCSWGYVPTWGNHVLAFFVGLESAVNYATAKGSLVVVAAGNEGNGAIRIPGAYSSAYCIGSTTSTDARSDFSCFGPAVDIAAPGSSILSTQNGGGYVNKSGTSMATPCAAGAAAVLWSRFPAYSVTEIRSRFAATATPLPGLGLGAGRIDLFEAVFNGSFEDGTKGWTATGTAGAVGALGPLGPTDRKLMGFASSGPADANLQTTLEQPFTIQPGVTNFKVSFDYDFVSEEYPEWVNRGFNDNVRITLVKPDGTSTQLAYEDIDHSPYSIVGGIDFPGGDLTTGHTGWKTKTANVPVTSGPGNYKIVIRDEGDGIYDSNILIDRIRFK
ncbi:MAG: S8 family serine peptidase [Opitutaceae bacterium]|nr:S8 family serine peptidase [Opitutaceae bacterium]